MAPADQAARAHRVRTVTDVSEFLSAFDRRMTKSGYLAVKVPGLVTGDFRVGPRLRLGRGPDKSQVRARVSFVLEGDVLTADVHDPVPLPVAVASELPEFLAVVLRNAVWEAGVTFGDVEFDIESGFDPQVLGVGVPADQDERHTFVLRRVPREDQKWVGPVVERAVLSVRFERPELALGTVQGCGHDPSPCAGGCGDHSVGGAVGLGGADAPLNPTAADGESASAADDSVRPGSVWEDLADHLAKAVLEFADDLHQAEERGAVDDLDVGARDRLRTEFALQCLDSVGLLQNLEGSIPELIRRRRTAADRGHHKLLALHGLVTRYVTEPLLASVRWLQRKDQVRQPAVPRGGLSDRSGSSR
ncbi:hypothetical protein SEA_HANNAHD_44 [Gordonia phage HannahD]|nr:hypothetical protein SEA_HANNAHD_44 [Gordonia phage HannahD]